MQRIMHFLRYDNAVPIVLGIVFLGATGAYAATNPDAIYSETQEVLSVDNTYIVEKDLSGYTPRVEITGVTEDDLNYYVAYRFSTIDVQDYVWQDVVKDERLQVEKQFLGSSLDLGLYATKQLKELIDNELARLTEVQAAERTRVSQKVVATAYGGLIGTFLDETTEALPGYTPVVTPPTPDLSRNTPVTPGDPRERPASLTQAELEALIQQQVNDALASHKGEVAGAATSAASRSEDAQSSAAGAPRVVGGNEGAPAGPSATTRDADTATTTTSSENETAADASSVGTEAPDGSSASTFGIDANTATSSTPAEIQPSRDDAPQPAAGTPGVTGTGAPDGLSAPNGEPSADTASTAPAADSSPPAEPEAPQTAPAPALEAANDNQPAEPLPATGTE
jgi:hypothetical protein